MSQRQSTDPPPNVARATNAGDDHLMRWERMDDVLEDAADALAADGVLGEDMAADLRNAWAALRPQRPQDPEGLPVVTGHYASQMVEILRERSDLSGDCIMLPRASGDDIEGRQVFGSVPLHIACRAALVTEVSLRLPRELRKARSRGELTREELSRFADQTEHYVVRRVG